MNSMTQKNAEEKLKEILGFWCDHEFKRFPGLIGVTQFGSTTKSPLKYETDLDLLMVFESLPQGRWNQFKLTEQLENKMNSDLKQLEGFHLEVSLILRSESSLDHLSPFYLDFVDHSKIWFDPESVMMRLHENIKRWIDFHGAYKVEKGNLWYWVYDSKTNTKDPVSFKFIQKK